MVKVCRICKETKNIDDFPLRKNAKDGHRNECKQCHNDARKRIYLENIEKEKETRKNYYLKNLDKIRIIKKEYYENNKEYFQEKRKKYYIEHQEEIKEHNKKYREEHQKEITAKRKEKRHNNEKYYFEIYLRNKINNYLYRYGKIKKRNNIQEILGCNYDEFKKYIESKFQDGMNWENRGKWHLDHIIPLATAKNYEDLVKLNHYSNFQPLWAIDNLKKGSSIEGGIL